METFKPRENVSDSSFREESTDKGQKEAHRPHNGLFVNPVFIERNEIIF